MGTTTRAEQPAGVTHLSSTKNDLPAVSADILTEISNGVDKWLWFVEALHQDA